MKAETANALGLTGRDVRHIGLLVGPKLEKVDGQIVETIGLSFTHGIGELQTCHPVDYFFYLVDANGNPPEGFKFRQVQAEGRGWDGIHIHPSRGITISFTDSTQRVVKMTSDCACDFFRHPFSIAIEDGAGNAYLLDPGSGNGGDPGFP